MRADGTNRAPAPAVSDVQRSSTTARTARVRGGAGSLHIGGLRAHLGAEEAPLARTVQGKPLHQHRTADVQRSTAVPTPNSCRHGNFNRKELKFYL